MKPRMRMISDDVIMAARSLACEKLETFARVNGWELAIVDKISDLRNGSPINIHRDIRGARKLTVHCDLTDDPHLLLGLSEYLKNGSLLLLKGVQSRLRGCWKADQEPDLDLELLEGALDLEGLFNEIRNEWFSDLPNIYVTWMVENPLQRCLAVLGEYYEWPPEIRINPRLDQPLVARVFVEYIIFHELCHHRTNCQPTKANVDSAEEDPWHGPQFLGFMKRYPHLDEACAWHRRNIGRFMGYPVPTPVLVVDYPLDFERAERRVEGRRRKAS